MNIVIDIGNTWIKLGAFEGDTLLEFQEALSQEQTIRYCESAQPQHILLSSVSASTESLRAILVTFCPDVRILTSSTPIPFANHYETPHTLGTDRMAAVAGAQALYPGEPCLVIDLGTCITYDMINANGQYWGGSISPGMRMRLKAMHSFTSRLPLLEPGEARLIGRNTREAMLSGAVNGTAAELDGIIAAYQHTFPSIRTLLCGGDAAFFETRIKAPIFVVPTLVLVGLNSILWYNLSRS